MFWNYSGNFLHVRKNSYFAHLNLKYKKNIINIKLQIIDLLTTLANNSHFSVVFGSKATLQKQISVRLSVCPYVRLSTTFRGKRDFLDPLIQIEV